MDSVLWIKNARLITLGRTDSSAWLRCVKGKIDAVGAGDFAAAAHDQVLDAQGLPVLPGFIDLHVHGSAGHEAMDASVEGLRAMAQFYARHGVTSFLATTWTDSQARIQHALEAVAAAQQTELSGGAQVLGAHLEGPYLNPARCGAQSTTHIRRASHAEALPWLEMNVLRLVALAPEYPENHWLIRECQRRGITVSAAHTAATYDEMREAVALGLTQTTHTYNAMTGLHHREPGTLGAALTAPEIRCEVIADTIHVHPAALRLLWLAKGADRVILITDAVRSAGLPDGEYPIDDRVVVMRDGVVRLPDGTLAGSTLTMNRALANFMDATGESLTAVWQASSLNAARAIGLEASKGSITVGKDADLVIVDDRLNVKCTVVAGRIVHETFSQTTSGLEVVL